MLSRLTHLAVVLALALLAVPRVVSAQSDEIQVYDGGLADVGTVNLTWHNNVIPKGLTTPTFPAGVVANHSFNGVTEWALGVTPWFEAGLYLPLYSHDPHLGWGVNGVKLRALFAVPHADERRFFYGANFEFSVNARRWDATRLTSEVRPIVGWHLKPVDVILNPILDTAYDGLGRLDFDPAIRVAYTVSPGWVAAVETYSDVGQVRALFPHREQTHQIFAVVDRSWRGWEVEAGAGLGLTHESDKATLKLIVSHDLGK